MGELPDLHVHTNLLICGETVVPPHLPRAWEEFVRWLPPPKAPAQSNEQKDASRTKFGEEAIAQALEKFPWISREKLIQSMTAQASQPRSATNDGGDGEMENAGVIKRSAKPKKNRIGEKCNLIFPIKTNGWLNKRLNG